MVGIYNESAALEIWIVMTVLVSPFGKPTTDLVCLFSGANRELQPIAHDGVSQMIPPVVCFTPSGPPQIDLRFAWCSKSLPAILVEPATSLQALVLPVRNPIYPRSNGGPGRIRTCNQGIMSPLH